MATLRPCPLPISYQFHLDPSAYPHVQTNPYRLTKQVTNLGVVRQVSSQKGSSSRTGRDGWPRRPPLKLPKPSGSVRRCKPLSPRRPRRLLAACALATSAPARARQQHARKATTTTSKACDANRLTVTALAKDLVLGSHQA